MARVFVSAYNIIPILVIDFGHKLGRVPRFMFSRSDSPLRCSISFPCRRTFSLFLPIMNLITNADFSLSYDIGMLCFTPF